MALTIISLFTNLVQHSMRANYSLRSHADDDIEAIQEVSSLHAQSFLYCDTRFLCFNTGYIFRHELGGFSITYHHLLLFKMWAGWCNLFGFFKGFWSSLAPTSPLQALVLCWSGCRLDYKLLWGLPRLHPGRPWQRLVFRMVLILAILIQLVHQLYI